MFYSKLSKDLSFLLNGSYGSDVVIRVGEGQNMKEFYTHSVFLRVRSPYFERALSDSWAVRNGDMIIFKKPNIGQTVFKVILNYFYTGNFDLSEQSGEDILKFLDASDELLIEELLEYIQDYLIENQTSWIQQNFDNVLRTAFRLVRCKKLQHYCLEYICKDPTPFISSETFPSLDKDILLGLLKKDNLLIEEVVIWDHLIKWGVEQTPGLNGDRTELNYEALKEMLEVLIPLIRFAEISPADFYDKVRPYEAAIPKHIYEEVIIFHFKKVLPNSVILLPRSTIIKSNIATVITNLIDRNDSAVLSPNNKYKFNLIYSKSRDGLNNVTFCDKQVPFVVFIRVQSKKIYGVYNPIGYVSRRGQWFSSEESFIFSFEDDQDMQNIKIGRVIDPKFNICDDEKLFNFGDQLYYDERNLHLKKSGKYSSITNDNYTTLLIEEIEVFNVVNFEKIKNSNN